MKQYLFVYGTLRKGLAPLEIAETVEKLKFVGEGFIYGSLYDLGEYPAALLGASDKVFGEIFELPDDKRVLQKLDEYEGFYPNSREKSLYVRKRTTAYVGNEKLRTWIYESNQDLSNFPIIESGNYSNLQTI